MDLVAEELDEGALARKLGLRVHFVGTDFFGLLAQVESGRFDVGSASINATDARRRTVELGGLPTADMFRNVYTDPHPLVEEQAAWFAAFEAGFEGVQA